MKSLTELIAKYGDKEIDEKKFKELFDIKDSKVFIPKVGEYYWFINEEGKPTTYLFENDALDQDIIKYNIVFPTIKEAAFARDKRAFKIKMKRDFAENSDEIDWDDILEEKYYILYDYADESIIADCNYIDRHEGTLYTTNEEWLKQYIKDNGANIKKYVFGIKEDE